MDQWIQLLSGGILVVILIVGCVVAFRAGDKGIQQPEAKYLDLTPASGKVRACQISWFEDIDRASYRDIYQLNETERFPPDGMPEFEKTLEKEGGQFITLKLDGKAVACGGFTTAPEVDWLVFGLVHPDHQRQGWGTTLLLARLASMPLLKQPRAIGLTAVPTSQDYYARFGFTQIGTDEMNGMTLSVMIAFLTEELRIECRSMLEEAGICLKSMTREERAA